MGNKKFFEVIEAPLLDSCFSGLWSGQIIVCKAFMMESRGCGLAGHSVSFD